MRNIILMSGLLLALTSCGNKSSSYAEEIKTIDSLLVLVTDMQAGIDSVSMDTVSMYSAVVKEKMNVLKSRYPDTTDREFWVLEMGVFAKVDRGLSKFKSNAPNIMAGLKTSEKQLRTLRNSLEDNKLDSAEVKSYMKVETNEFLAVQHQFYRRQRVALSALELYPYALAHMDSIIATLPEQ